MGGRASWNLHVNKGVVGLPGALTPHFAAGRRVVASSESRTWAIRIKTNAVGAASTRTVDSVRIWVE